jgi:hypothetical protein
MFVQTVAYDRMRWCVKRTLRVHSICLALPYVLLFQGVIEFSLHGANRSSGQQANGPTGQPANGLSEMKGLHWPPEV